LPCPALPCALAALRAIRAGQKKKFCPAGQGRAGQGVRARGLPCPDDGLCFILMIVEIKHLFFSFHLDLSTFKTSEDSFYSDDYSSDYFG